MEHVNEVRLDGENRLHSRSSCLLYSFAIAWPPNLPQAVRLSWSFPNKSPALSTTSAECPSPRQSVVLPNGGWSMEKVRIHHNCDPNVALWAAGAKPKIYICHFWEYEYTLVYALSVEISCLHACLLMLVSVFEWVWCMLVVIRSEREKARRKESSLLASPWFLVRCGCP